MKIAIVGSRSFIDKQRFETIMQQYYLVSKIISGGARGADSLAKEWAIFHDIEYEEYLPDWSKGKSAGFERNTQIVEAADFVIAFWDLHSRGTKDTINKALLAGKAVHIYPI